MELTCLSCRHQVLGGTQLGLTTLFNVAFDCIVAGKEEVRREWEMCSFEVLNHCMHP